MPIRGQEDFACHAQKVREVGGNHKCRQSDHARLGRHYVFYCLSSACIKPWTLPDQSRTGNVPPRRNPLAPPSNVMYEVPATSAFVLLFTPPDFYKGQAAGRFLEQVDLTAGEGLRSQFKEHWDVAYAAIGSRKARVRQLSQSYLHKNPTAQVISLASGLDPMTLALAEQFPGAAVYDVDMSQMDVKADINATIDGPKVNFVTADLADTAALRRVLADHGWDAELPTLVIAEGITYYVPASVFAQTLGTVRTSGGALVLEYSIPDDAITDVKYRNVIIDFYKELSNLLQMPFPLVRYSLDYVQQLAEQLGGTVELTLADYHGELALTGRNEYFETMDSGVIRVSLITF